MWPSLVQTAKEGGCNAIESYVFWNGHEPSPGKVEISISSNYTVFAITTLGRYCNISQMFVELSVHQFFVCCWLVVLFWRTVWYSEVHQDCSASWNAHDSANWSFCCGRVEFRVMLFLYNPSFITNSVPFVVFVIESCGYRGVPVWLHYVPGTVFRADNEPWKVGINNIVEFVFFHCYWKFICSVNFSFQHYMESFTAYIVNLLKKEKLFAPQGGPIILSQARQTTTYKISASLCFLLECCS